MESSCPIVQNMRICGYCHVATSLFWKKFVLQAANTAGWWSWKVCLCSSFIWSIQRALQAIIPSIHFSRKTWERLLVLRGLFLISPCASLPYLRETNPSNFLGSSTTVLGKLILLEGLVWCQNLYTSLLNSSNLCAWAWTQTICRCKHLSGILKFKGFVSWGHD